MFGENMSREYHDCLNRIANALRDYIVFSCRTLPYEGHVKDMVNTLRHLDTIRNVFICD